MSKLKKETSIETIIKYLFYSLIVLAISYVTMKNKRTQYEYENNEHLIYTIDSMIKANTLKGILLEKEFDNKPIDTIYIQEIIKINK